MRSRASVVVVVLLLPVALPAGAATIHVPSGQPTIQTGIDAASAGDTVLVAVGTYPEHGILMKPGVCLAGATGAAVDVIIDAGGLGRVISCDSADSTTSFVGLTFEGGAATSGSYYEQVGAGIHCVDSSPRISRCAFVGNVAGWHGGGVHVSGDSCPLVTDCTFTQNTADDGGGAYVDSGSALFTRCEFSHNTADYSGGGLSLGEDTSAELQACTFGYNESGQGGGLYCGWASITAEDCRFEYNNGPYGGGGAAVAQSPARFANCDFFSNWANWGGAVAVGGVCHPVFEFCTFSFNMATFEGGAVSSSATHAEFAYCTLVDNEASDGAAATCMQGYMELLNCVVAFNGPGEAISCYFHPGCECVAHLRCSNVYGNTNGDWVGFIEDQYGEPGNLWMDPLFCRDDNPDAPYTLDWRSPCAAYSAPNGDCDQIGAWGVACGPSTGFEGGQEAEMTWGAIKALYRR